MNISTRDFFAATASEPDIYLFTPEPGPNGYTTGIERIAARYAYADAMLAEAKKEKE